MCSFRSSASTEQATHQKLILPTVFTSPPAEGPDHYGMFTNVRQLGQDLLVQIAQMPDGRI